MAASGEQDMKIAFGDELTRRVERRASQLVLGLDPDPEHLWSSLPEPADALREHCERVIAAAGPACVAVKPQLARFELFGAAGRLALGEAVDAAHAAGLLVIADGKRGDIDVTARAYGQSLFGSAGPALAGLGADLATVNPLMGPDAVEPFVSEARAAGAGVLVLVRTSNPGAALIQDAQLADGGTVWEALAGLVDELGRGSAGECGLDDVGAVVGATVPAHLERARALMPRAAFLLPGIGVQGGRIEDLAPAFRPGRAGGLVSASRSIVNAHRDGGGAPEQAARAAAETLRESAWELSSAVLGAS